MSGEVLAASSKPVVRVKAGDSTGASARPIASASLGTSYNAADLGHPALSGWAPPLMSADSEWLHDRNVSIGRIRDLERNDGSVASGMDRLVDMLVGQSLRPNAKPDAGTLGVEPSVANDLGRDIQSKWRKWAEDPIFRGDAERQLPFNGLAALMAREFVGVGEGLALLRWKERDGWPFRTAVQIIDPDRLSQPHGMPESDTMRGGVEKDGDNAPIAYHIRRGHPSDFFGLTRDPWQWDRIPRWDQIGGWERPKVLHLYDKKRPGQSRGVSKLVAELVNTRLVNRFSRHEVNTAAINASIVGAIYSQLGADYAAERIGTDTGGTDWNAFVDQRASFYENRRVLEDARFIHLFPTDKLDLNSQPRQTAGFPAFRKSFLQSFASNLGISYEQLSQDWSSTNYSSARAALNEVWRGVMRLRAILIWGFAKPVYTAWLEDAIDAEEIELPAGAPDFHDEPLAYLNCDWIGPGRGYVDPVKEAQASELRRNARTSTLEFEAAEQGQDWESVLAQQAREAAEMQRLGLTSSTDLSIEPRTDREDRRPGE